MWAGPFWSSSFHVCAGLTRPHLTLINFCSWGATVGAQAWATWAVVFGFPRDVRTDGWMCIRGLGARAVCVS